MMYDIYMVGLGGQGILTIGEILAESASRCQIPVNFFPAKGMAQRGGVIRAQLRLGRGVVGPNIPINGANLVIAMEVSEALRAIRFARPGADFRLFGSVWRPITDVHSIELYPTLKLVLQHLHKTGSRVYYINPEKLPQFNELSVPGNMYVLGVALENTQLGSLLDPNVVANVILDRWGEKSDRNHFALQSGLSTIQEYEHK